MAKKAVTKKAGEKRRGSRSTLFLVLDGKRKGVFDWIAIAGSLDTAKTAAAPKFDNKADAKAARPSKAKRATFQSLQKEITQAIGRHLSLD